MLELLSEPWPWYLAGPLIGLMVPLLLLLIGKPFGVSSSLRHICAATVPRGIEYFRYDWKRRGGWSLIFVLGILLGGVIAALLLENPDPIAISPATHADLAALGITDFDGLVPDDLISWSSLGTAPGLIVIVLGGFLLGFVRAVGAVLLDQHRDLLAWLGADAQPIVDAIGLQHGSGVGVGDARVIRSQFLQNATIAGRPFVDGTNAIERPMGSAHFLHANSD